MHAHDTLNQTNVIQSAIEAPPPPDQPYQNRSEAAKKYSRIKIKLGILSTIIFFTVSLTLVVTGVTTYFETLSYRVTDSAYLALLIFALLFGAVSGALSFPLSLYSGHILEHKFGLSTQSFGAWLLDSLKGLLVGIALATPVLLIFYHFLLSFDRMWWLPVGVVMIFFSIILARIAPTIIFPIFFKFKPLADGPLKERILERCRTAGMNVKGIYQFNMSSKTKKANAAFAGIGKSKRIILGDTLIDEFNNEEIDVVFSHELGHYSLGHIKKSMAVGIVFTLIALYIAAQLYELSIGWFGFDHITQLAALPLLSIWLGIYSLLTGPLSNWLSRRHEYEADRFALDLTGNPGAFISTMKKLSHMNLSDPDPPRWVEILFHSHPTINKRIAAAMQTQGGETK